MSFLRTETNKLLLRIQQGDKESRGLLFQLTYNHLVVVARKYLKDKNYREDIVSSALLRAFEYIHSFDPTQDGYNWLCKIVQNLCYDFNKKNGNWVQIDKCVGIASDEDIETKIEQRDEIEKYLSVYSEQDRKFIRLRIENLSYAEIAKRTGCKRSYVHKRVSKVLKDIQKKQKNKK